MMPWMRVSGRSVRRIASMWLNNSITPVSASRPSHAWSWCAGAPEKTKRTTSMFMQQLPNPGADACVAVDECERTSTSAPLNAPALYMTVFDAGDAISSAGVPYTVTVPGVFELVRTSATATAAARVACREPGDELRRRERALELVHAADRVGGGAALGGRLLGSGSSGSEDGNGGDAKGETHGP